MEVWECRQVIDFDQSTTTVKRRKEQNSSLDESDKSIVYKSYIGTQSDLTQVMTLNKKVKAQPLSLIGHMGSSFGCELWITVNCEIRTDSFTEQCM